MDSNILAAFISAGVSLVFSVIYWWGKHIYRAYLIKELFKTYKSYTIEFLESCIKLVEDKEITSNGTKYQLKDFKLGWVWTGNMTQHENLNLIDSVDDTSKIVSVVLYLLDVKYKYSFQTKWNLSHFLLNIYPKIFVHKNVLMDKEDTANNNTICQIGFKYKDILLNVWNNNSYYKFIVSLDQLKIILSDTTSHKYDEYIKNTVKELYNKNIDE